MCSGSSEAKSGENTSAKLTYSMGIFIGVSLAIKPAIGLISSREELGNISELSDAMCTTKVLLSGSSAAAVNSFLPTSSTDLGGVQEGFLGGISLLSELPI